MLGNGDSSFQFHHLAGVGHLLGSIIQSPLSQHTYLRVRTVLLALADMTASLEVALSATSDIAGRLRGHVSRIDTYMTEAALQHQHAYVPPMGMSISGSMSDHPYLPMVPQVSNRLTFKSVLRTVWTAHVQHPFFVVWTPRSSCSGRYRSRCCTTTIHASAIGRSCNPGSKSRLATTHTRRSRPRLTPSVWLGTIGKRLSDLSVSVAR